MCHYYFQRYHVCAGLFIMSKILLVVQYLIVCMFLTKLIIKIIKMSKKAPTCLFSV